MTIQWPPPGLLLASRTPGVGLAKRRLKSFIYPTIMSVKSFFKCLFSKSFGKHICLVLFLRVIKPFIAMGYQGSWNWSTSPGPAGAVIQPVWSCTQLHCSFVPLWWVTKPAMHLVFLPILAAQNIFYHIWIIWLATWLVKGCTWSHFLFLSWGQKSSKSSDCHSCQN